MPIFSGGRSQPKSSKPIEFVWDTFRKGLNLLLRENEVDPQELTQADNIILIGKGIPTKRWGIDSYYTAGATGAVRGLSGFYKSDGSNELLAITDDGYLTKQNGTSFSTLTGASWASGYPAYMAQLSNKMYIVNGQRELVRYGGPTLVGFPTIARPVITGATNLSNATGTTTKAYRVTAVSQVGETLGSEEFTLPSQPASLGDPSGGTIRLTWTGVSAASGVLQGFNVYGRDGGNERFIAGVGPQATTYDDDGSAIPSEFSFPPTADSTGGPKAKYIMRFQDRLVFAGISGEPSKVIISAREPDQEKFDIASGGNYVNIEKDSGDDIVQIASFRDRIIVFKQRSIWQITLSSEQIGNFFVTTPNLQLITNSYGCVASGSVVAVENDLYFLSRTGVNTLGYQTGFAFDLLRSNEISIKVRPFFEGLTISQKMNAVAAYFNKKYLITFPGYDKTMVFDTERGAWVGPWTFDANKFNVYFDSNSEEHLLIGRDDGPTVDEMSAQFRDDNGVAISTTLKTRQEDFGDWALLKNMNSVFLQFRNNTGRTNIDIRIEDIDGQTRTAESITLISDTSDGNSGWGADMWGAALWGNSNESGGIIETQQLIKWRELNETARTIQMTVSTTNAGDNYELLGIRGDAIPQGRGILPDLWRQ